MNDAMSHDLYPPGGEKANYVHTLSLRLTAQGYRRLRRFVLTQEEVIGHRLTHQAVLEAALSQFLQLREPAHVGESEAPAPGE